MLTVEILSEVVHRCYVCGETDKLELVGTIDRKPERETDFNIDVGEYHREIWACNNCQAYNNFHPYQFDEIYDGQYNESTYTNKILDNYNRVMNLDEGQSDNRLRVQRIAENWTAKDRKLEGAKVLDVGSGLCVFLGEFMKYGIEAYCVDPDPVSIDHAKKNVGVKEAYQGYIADIGFEQKFDIITFNKVLEHVVNPVEILSNSSEYLAENGMIYVELPDGENALNNEPLEVREEFFIEHYTVFSLDSLKIYIEASGLELTKSEAIYEPSTKYTVYGFCVRKKQ
ncbi:MAG: class I SAM-dependent methyltransferase [Bacteroidetes bacterium]|nr:class I SAM-dependent methyltransferase [Bacteroidota bacterium]